MVLPCLLLLSAGAQASDPAPAPLSADLPTNPLWWGLAALAALEALAILLLFLQGRRQARLAAQLRAGEERYREIFDNISDLIYTQDMEGRFTSLNQAIRTMLDFQPSELLGKAAAQIMLPQHRQGFYDQYLPKLRAEGYCEGVGIYLAKDGSRRYLEYRSTLVKHPGRQPQISGVARDVTRQKLAEKALHASEERYRNLIDSISDFIYTHDMQGRLLSINRTACQNLGFDPQELIGMSIGDLMPPELRQAFGDEYLAALAAKQTVFKGVSKYLAKNGSLHFIEWHNRVVNEGGKPPYVSGSGRDITERVLAEREMRRLEEQLAQAQKMEAVGVLAGGIAHDFNNILQVISGYVQLLLQGRGDGDDQRQYLERIERSVRRAADLVRGLLTFSRKAERRPQRVDLNQEVEQVAHLLERTLPKMVGIATRLAPDLLPIVADPAQLEQVLVNLASNAKDAMPEGGQLTLETSNFRLAAGERAPVLDQPPGDYVLVKVEDTGTGMDRQTLEHIFEPFFTTKEVGKGTGLGLATVYGIVKSHRGFIACQSHPGRGSTFLLYLPAAGAGEVVEAVPHKTPPPVSVGRELILLVDDERAILDIAQSALEDHGYRALLASSGEEALQVLDRRGGEVDLVVLDLGMPGMGGRRCLKEMKRLHPGLKVLIASGYASTDQRGDSREEGAADFIAKPYRLEDLLDKIRRLLDQASPPSLSQGRQAGLDLPGAAADQGDEVD